MPCQHPQISQIAKLDVFQELLGDLIDPQLLPRFVAEVADQIQYSVERFAGELVVAGFTPDFALTTARQIVPKPVLYAMVIDFRSEEHTPAIPHFPQTAEGARRRQAYRGLQYELLAPGFVAYLFDQTIDEYNPNRREGTWVEQEIAQAATRLPTAPHYYRDALRQLLAFCLERAPAAPGMADLPPDVRAYWLLAPYIRRLSQAGIQPPEIADVLYTVSDVLVHEHLGSLAYNRGRYADRRFVRPIDFVDDTRGVARAPQVDTPEETVARCALRGQGYLMISVSQYLVKQIDFRYDPQVGDYVGRLRDGLPHPPVRRLLQQFPFIVDCMRLYEVIVKVGDDLGDVALDQERGALNWITAGEAALEAFIRISRIEETAIESEALKERFVALMRGTVRYLQEQQSASPAGVAARLNTITDWLLPLEQAITRAMLAYLSQDLRAEGESEKNVQKHLRLFIRIMREVVFGSIINARYNDESAEALGIYFSAGESNGDGR